MNALPMRKHNRMKCFDYASAGCYFITLCVKDRCELLGSIKNVRTTPVGNAFMRSDIRPDMRPEPKFIYSAIGNIVRNEIEKLETRYDNLKIDKYVIMPNHIHEF